MKIIGVCGLIGSGKGSVADILVGNHNIQKVSFADSLKDMVANVLIVVQGHTHELLLSNGLLASQLHWIAGSEIEDRPMTNWVYAAKTRYRQPDAPCEIERLTSDEVEIKFGQKQWAVTPGQSAVVYESNVCLGGGIITAPL